MKKDVGLNFDLVIIDEWIAAEESVSRDFGEKNMIISEYSNENREAKVLSNGKGSYTVCMMEGEKGYSERTIESCTLRYAQDLAENFVMRWGEFK